MNKELQKVIQKRAELISKISNQRDQIAQIGAKWRLPLSFADHALQVVQYVRSHPVLVAGFFALLVVKRSGIVGIASYGWRLWKWYRSAKSFSSQLINRI